MDNSNQAEELSALIKTVRENLFNEYHERFSELFNDFGLGYEYDPTPLEIFAGIAQALADVSGYRIVLQAEVLEPIEGDPNMKRSVGHLAVAHLEPTIFSQSP
jgi:hypothetical protein